VPQDRGHHLHGVGPRQDRLDAVVGRRDTAGDSQGTCQLAVQDGKPSEPQQELVAVRQGEARRHGQVLDIEVRLKEPVEQHEAIGTRPIELARHVAEGREER